MPLCGYESINATIGTPPGGSGKCGADAGAHVVQLSVIPNPSADVFRFLLALPETGHVLLQLTDVTGRTVAIVVDGILEAGEHFVRFDGAHLSGGVYFYRLITDAGIGSGTLAIE